MAIELSSEVILGRSGNIQLLIALASVPLCDGRQQGMLSICCYEMLIHEKFICFRDSEV